MFLYVLAVNIVKSIVSISSRLTDLIMSSKKLVTTLVAVFVVAVVAYRRGWNDGYQNGYQLATARKMIDEGYDLEEVAEELSEE